ncbi:hypothetical protein AKO1_009676 [Acrasis kona]|uniref:PX domain-containing protein n=1 Tax=Acrasis kona TaxID=1008807 RepID=A0AAW2ZPW3_9EUKA
MMNESAYTNVSAQFETRSLSVDAEYKTQFEAKIDRNKQHYDPDTGDNVTYYRIQIKRTRVPLGNMGSFSVSNYSNEHRYMHFLELYQSLQKRHPQCVYPSFPPKRYDTEAPETIKERLIGLEGFIQFILSNESLANDREVLEFFGQQPLNRAKNLVKKTERTWFDSMIDYLAYPFIALENNFNTEKIDKKYPAMFGAPTNNPNVRNIPDNRSTSDLTVLEGDNI